MPRVPVYERQVSTRPLPTPYQRPAGGPEASGAQLGGALQHAGGQLQALARHEQERADRAKVLLADTALGEWEQRAIHDPKSGALTTRGEQAIGAVDRALQDFDATAGEVEKGLTSDAQREAFAARRAQAREQVARTLAGHERAQFREMEAGAYAGALATSVSRAVSAAGDEKAVLSARRDGEAALALRAESEGWSDQQLEGERRQFRTQLHTGVLERLSEASPDAAEAYLGRYGQEMDGAVRGRLEKQLRHLAGDRRALAETRRIQAAATDFGAQMKLAREIKDPKVLDAVSARLEEDARDGAAAQRQQVDQVFNSAFTGYIKGGGLRGVPPKAKAWLIENAPAKWRDLQELARADADRYRTKSAQPTAAQGQAMVEFLLQAGGDPQRLASMTPAEFNSDWAHRLAPADREQAAARIAGAKAEANKPDRNPALAGFVEKRLTAAGSQAGLWPANVRPDLWTKEQSAAYYAAHQEVAEKEALWRQEHAGKPAPDEKYREWIEGATLRLKLPGTGLLFDDRTTLPEYRRDPRLQGKPVEPLWTDEQRERAGAVLRQRGALLEGDPATDVDRMVESYLRRTFQLPAAADPGQGAGAPNLSTGPTPGE